MYLVSSIFLFDFTAPPKKMPYALPFTKIFQFCSKLFNESIRPFFSFVQAVWKWEIGRTRSGLRDSLKDVEKN